MRQVIDGMLYDTDEAEEIESYWNDLGSSDFDHLKEKLYRTDKGNWFLYVKGGAKTRAANRVPGGARSYGTMIEPLEPEEVVSWAEKRGKTSLIEEHFADHIKKA